MVCTAVYILVIHMARVCHTAGHIIGDIAGNTLEMESEEELSYKSFTGKPETLPLQYLRDPIVNIALGVFHSLLVFSKENYKHVPDFMEKYDNENLIKESRKEEKVKVRFKPKFWGIENEIYMFICLTLACNIIYIGLIIKEEESIADHKSLVSYSGGTPPPISEDIVSQLTHTLSIRLVSLTTSFSSAM